MKSGQQKKSLDRFIYESMGEKQYLISCLDDELFKKALKGFRKECPEIDSRTNGFRMCLEALQSELLGVAYTLKSVTPTLTLAF